MTRARPWRGMAEMLRRRPHRPPARSVFSHLPRSGLPLTFPGSPFANDSFRCQSRRKSRRPSLPIRATAASSTFAAASCASRPLTSAALAQASAEQRSTRSSSRRTRRASSCTSAAVRRGGTTASASTSGQRCSPRTRSVCFDSTASPARARAARAPSSRPSSRGSASSDAFATGSRAFDPATIDSRFPSDRRIVYVVDLPATRLYQRGLVVDLATQRRAPNGEWGTPKQFSLREDQWADAPERSTGRSRRCSPAPAPTRASSVAATASRDAITSSHRRSARRFASCARADDAA